MNTIARARPCPAQARRTRQWQLAVLVGIAAACLVLAPPVRAQAHGAGHGGGSPGGHGGGHGGDHGGDRGGGHGGGRGGGWHGGGAGWWGLGLGLGLGWGVAELADPYSYGSDDYPNAAPMAPYPGNAPAPSQAVPSAGAWYYCESAKTYYPYVDQCPEGWRAVAPTPPGATP
jgi:hypothetical protein